MPGNTYRSGQWNVICDCCGGKFKSGIMRERWDGLIVCPNDYEQRQPQDFVLAKPDKFTVPFVRPQPPLVSTDVTYINQYVYTNYLEDYSDYITDPQL